MEWSSPDAAVSLRKHKLLRLYLLVATPFLHPLYNASLSPVASGWGEYGQQEKSLRRNRILSTRHSLRDFVFRPNMYGSLHVGISSRIRIISSALEPRTIHSVVFCAFPQLVRPTKKERANERMDAFWTLCSARTGAKALSLGLSCPVGDSTVIRSGSVYLCQHHGACQPSLDLPDAQMDAITEPL